MKDLSNKIVSHKQKNGVEYLQFRELEKYSKYINHAFILRNKHIKKEELDFSNANSIEQLKENYKIVSSSLGFNCSKILRCYQGHTDNIQNVEDKDYLSIEINEEFKNTDAIISNKKNAVVSLNSGDCMPILIFDKDKKIFANVHSGWKGILSQIGKKAVVKMMNEYNSKLEDLLVFIGPTLKNCCFQIKDDVKSIFDREFPDFEEYIVRKNQDSYIFDSVGIITEIFIEMGINPKNIFDSGICTKCNNDQIFSYRGGDIKTGRSALIVELI